MHGNFWEWCGDNWHENYEDAPDNGRVWIDDESNIDDSNIKVLRGGSWNVYPWDCRSAFRLWFAPDAIYYNCGFRCVASRTK